MNLQAARHELVADRCELIDSWGVKITPEIFEAVCAKVDKAPIVYPDVVPEEVIPM